MDLTQWIRDVQDWPKPGIIFKDITPLLGDNAALRHAIAAMAEPFADQGVEMVVGAESRGFIFGAAIAANIGAGFVPIRKPNKLPWKTHQMTYDLEYGSDTLEIHQDAIKPGQRTLLVDDLLATGGTMKAAIDLVEKLEAHVVGVSVLIELGFLEGRAKLGSVDSFHAVITY